MALLEVRGVSFQAAGQRILDGLDLSISPMCY